MPDTEQGLGSIQISVGLKIATIKVVQIQHTNFYE